MEQLLGLSSLSIKFNEHEIISALCAAALDADGWQAAIDTVTRSDSTGAILLPVAGQLPVIALSEPLLKASERYFDERLA